MSARPRRLSRKKLIFLFDGTANSAANGRWADATNIFRLNLAIEYKGNQIVFYMPGVGTRGDYLSRATGRGMDEILREAYVNIASNFVAGDSVYLFGFSRGGAVALALADMIATVGLLWGDGLHELNTLWTLYIEGRRGGTLSANRRRELEATLTPRLRRGADEPKIGFLGLFDPVPGNRWDTLTHFSKARLVDPVLPSTVAAAVNLLSIDDNRNPSFSPVVIRRRSSPDQSLKQIWMPGVHADIGGCADGVFFSDAALLTMISEWNAHCPEVVWDEGYVDRLGQSFRSTDEISISYERPGLARKLLWKRPRRIGEGQSAEDGAQMLHPLVDLLRGKRFTIRRHTRTYLPSDVPASTATYAGTDTSSWEAAMHSALDEK
jgi:Uncharacterized alpha/beta hydrolase domain (DUF2235)